MTTEEDIPFLEEAFPSKNQSPPILEPIPPPWRPPQKHVVLAIGLVVAIAMLVFPPWEITGEERKWGGVVSPARQDLGYALFSDPPDRADIWVRSWNGREKRGKFGTVAINTSRLVIQLLILACVTGLALLVPWSRYLGAPFPDDRRLEKAFGNAPK